MDHSAASGTEVRNSAALQAAAHLGLVARGAVYLLLGFVTFALAFGQRRSEADQRGALQVLSTNSGGLVVLWAVAIGLACYALWRFTEAAVGTAEKGRKAGPRLLSFARGVAYTSLSYSAFSVIAGHKKSQASQSRELSARVMTHSGGRLLVGAIGAVIGVVGVALAVQGLRRSFEKKLRMYEMSAGVRRVVGGLGVVGTVARGAVFALVGALVIDAAVRFEPHKASGVDVALRTLAQQPFGQVLLIVTALGLFAFGVYGLAEAKWRIT